jgi:outer membrane lipoprotein-sorting protein
MLKNYFNANQGRILTALVLTGILSIASGCTLIKNATGASANFSLETSNEVTKDNIKLNRLPRPVANAVLRDLAGRQGISSRQLQIINYNQQTWRNGCLELPQADEFCTQALIPGWRIVVSDGKENWIYHTNQTGSAVRLNQKTNESTLTPVQIPVSELPPPLDRDIVFRQISSGGFAGTTYQTVLLKDGRLIRVRVGDANDSERTIRRVSVQQVQKFVRSLQRSKFSKFQNLSYPASSGAADYITYTQ